VLYESVPYVHKPGRISQPVWRVCGGGTTISCGGTGILCKTRDVRDILRNVRLTPDEVLFLSKKIVKTLVRGGKLEVDSEARVEEAIGKIITDDLMIEDRLNEEVREVLVQHANEMQRSNITYTEMFKMVKKKLAKEKGIIL
jgi:uncharacterized protein